MIVPMTMKKGADKHAEASSVPVGGHCCEGGTGKIAGRVDGKDYSGSAALHSDIEVIVVRLHSIYGTHERAIVPIHAIIYHKSVTAVNSGAEVEISRHTKCTTFMIAYNFHM